MSRKSKTGTVIFVISFIALLSFFVFFLLRTNQTLPFTKTQSVTDKRSISALAGLMIKKAFYDEKCTVKILISNGRTIEIPTDHQISDKTFNCYQTKLLQVSPNSKYVAFEGSDWQSKSPADGNFLGIYFVSVDDYAKWSIGAAELKSLFFDYDSGLQFEAFYSGDSSRINPKISLAMIENNFQQTVDKSTKELILIDGVLIK